MNIVITGGSRGIGSATAIALSEDSNNRILITGRNELLLKETSKKAVNGNISWFTADLSANGKQMGLLVSHISSEFSIVDVLINNAGYLVNKLFTDMQQEEIRDMMEINYFAPAMLIKELLPQMKRGSHIVNISSMGGFQGSVKFEGLAAYSASKAALATLTECLANELSPAGVIVNCLALGSVATEMVSQAFPGYKAPLEPAEMGRFIGWFAINGSLYFNGKVLPVALTTP
ncbi:MAG TPA: SDR family oxidoreductase [Bacteroidales bacterium]|nr:SDR family oxidoreductase [Bacteroidales bacterium]